MEGRRARPYRSRRQGAALQHHGHPQGAAHHLPRDTARLCLDQRAECSLCRQKGSRHHAWRRAHRPDAGAPLSRRRARQLVIRPDAVPVSAIDWRGAVRIIRSIYPPIDLFEDIADPADWPLLLSAEQKTNPRVMETIGNLDLVPPGRRVGGPGASWLMAPFTHVSPDRPSRFSDGRFGVLYVGDRFEVALFETVHHHGRFMRMTMEPAGWTSQFREIVMNIAGRLHDLREHAGEGSASDEWDANRA